MLLGAAVGGVSTCMLSSTDVSVSPQAAANKAMTRTRPAAAANALVRLPQRNARVLTPPMLSLTLLEFISDSYRGGS